MKRYANLSGNSGVQSYEISATRIRVKFVTGECYTYSHQSAGKETVETMKRLAGSGKGLSTYISRHARNAYEAED